MYRVWLQARWNLSYFEASQCCCESYNQVSIACSQDFPSLWHKWPSQVNSEEVCLPQFLRLHIFTLLAGCHRHNGLSGNDSWYVLNVTVLWSSETACQHYVVISSVAHANLLISQNHAIPVHEKLKRKSIGPALNFRSFTSVCLARWFSTCELSTSVVQYLVVCWVHE